MISSHPFSWREYSIVKAKIKDDSIEYLTEPEFHGNPMDPKAGSLVFSIPGWDILEMCLDAGFTSAEMVMIASERLGIFSSENGFINILHAKK